MRHRRADETGGREESELMEVQGERRKVRNLLDGLYESLVANDITDAEYRDIKTSYSSKMDALAAREKLLRQAGQERKETGKLLERATESLDAVKAGYVLTPGIVDGIIEKIKVFGDKSLRVKVRFIENELPSRETNLYG